jgi:hypothetical protein
MRPPARLYPPSWRGWPLVFSVDVGWDLEPMGLPRHDHAIEKRGRGRGQVERKLPRLHSLPGWHPHSTARSPDNHSSRCLHTPHGRPPPAAKATGRSHHATTTARAHYHCRRHRARPPNLATEHVASSWRLCMEEGAAEALGPPCYTTPRPPPLMRHHDAAI